MFESSQSQFKIEWSIEDISGDCSPSGSTTIDSGEFLFNDYLEDAIEKVKDESSLHFYEYMHIKMVSSDLSYQVVSLHHVAKDILREEIEHEAWFLELLYGRPSAHMRRKFPGERPHTAKHSRALG